MAGTGKQGSTVEGGMLSNVVGGARSEVNDFTRDQLISDLNRASGISDRNYQGDITQRGQDLSRQQSLLSMLTASGTVY